jgi:hypothetical protein
MGTFKAELVPLVATVLPPLTRQVSAALQPFAALAGAGAGNTEAGAYTRPLFGSTSALSMGEGVHVGVV